MNFASPGWSFAVAVTSETKARAATGPIRWAARRLPAGRPPEGVATRQGARLAQQPPAVAARAQRADRRPPGHEVAAQRAPAAGAGGADGGGPGTVPHGRVIMWMAQKNLKKQFN